jgi:hypothetical protein
LNSPHMILSKVILPRGYKNPLKKIITISPKWAYLFISIPILVVISWSALNNPLYTSYYSSDFWEHSATIHEWTKNLWHPGNPHMAIDTGSPRYMPFFFLLTVLARIFSLTPIQALGVGGVMTMILFLYGVWLFLGLYFRNDWAPFVGLIVLLGGWGAGWYWSNCYQLRCLFYVIPFPSSFVFSVSFLSFWLATKMLRQRVITSWRLIPLCIMSALMLLSHPLTGAFAIGSLCLLALSEPKVSFSHRWTLIAVVLTGALAAELWPYFSVWHVIFGTSGGEAASWVKAGNVVGHRIKMLYQTHPFYNPKQFFVTIGPGLFGIPALFYLAYTREHSFIISGFIVMSLPFWANLFFPIPLGHRFVFFMVFYLHLALIWGILRLQSKMRKATQQHTVLRFAKLKTGVLFSFLTLCLLWNGALSALALANYLVYPDLRFGPMQREPVVDDMSRLSLSIPDQAIVMAPARLSWPLPTFTGKVVAAYHINPMVADHFLRRRDTNSFFQFETTQEARLKILRRYKVTHILYEGKNIPESLKNDLEDFGSVVKKIGGYVIIKNSADSEMIFSEPSV